MLRERKRGERQRQRRRRGLAGLPVPPVSWDYLLLQSTVAQQKQREQQNYTHLPAQSFPHSLMRPTILHPAFMVITNITPNGCLWPFSRHQMQTRTHTHALSKQKKYYPQTKETKHAYSCYHVCPSCFEE